ncbi:MAG TPA: PssE/Cps14G family polysaccharide biosynthesis glycosyltransferase [Planctomycetota bacterium]|nr:PssE/Cps14G family polysaccharide biosynthesis glycosyltransferase [Phycisphaerae bacterium]HUW58049.1 PssE/Cps14G family polysaccharide biosynthesis glycosyltransferase [Planctomycetota bacterium]
MIFVTVGTTRFEDLVMEMDRLVGAGEITDEVFAQIGSGQYVPSNMKWTRYVKNIQECFRRADLVVCHGGAGTVFELLQIGARFIAVPNRSLQDDHQSDLCRALEARGWAVCCYDLDRLGSLFKKMPGTRAYPFDSALPSAVWDFLTSRDRSRQRSHRMKVIR